MTQTLQIELDVADVDDLTMLAYEEIGGTIVAAVGEPPDDHGSLQEAVRIEGELTVTVQEGSE